MEVIVCSSKEWKQRYYQLVNRVHMKRYRKVMIIGCSYLVAGSPFIASSSNTFSYT